MSIDPSCLAKVASLVSFPVTLHVIDTKGVKVGTAQLQADGRIIDLASHITYESPSELRAALVKHNIPTYEYLLVSLSDLGVGR